MFSYVFLLFSLISFFPQSRYGTLVIEAISYNRLGGFMQKVVLFINVTLSDNDDSLISVPQTTQSTQLSRENSAALDLSYAYLVDEFFDDTQVITEQGGKTALLIL